MKPMRIFASILCAAALLGGCTPVVHLRNVKTGQTATCGGELHGLNAAASDEHCLQVFHRQGFDPVPDAKP